MSNQKSAKENYDSGANLRRQLKGFRGKILNDRMDKQDNNPTAENLACMLLGEEFNLPNSYEEENEEKKELYIQFYKNFVTYIIKKYSATELDANLLLAMNKLSSEYQNKTIEERCRQYVQDHAEDDERLRVDWSNPYQNIIKTYEPKILDYIVPLLVTEITRPTRDRLFDAAEKIASELDENLVIRKKSNVQITKVIKPPVPIIVDPVPPIIDPVPPIIKPKISIRGKIIKVAIVAFSVLLFAVLVLCIILYNKNSKQIELEQIQHEGVTYSVIEHEDISTEDAPLSKPILKKISVCNEDGEEVKRVPLPVGESMVLVVRFYPNDADVNELHIESENKSIVETEVINTEILGKVPFLTKAMSRNARDFPICILVTGDGAIPACVNVYIGPNNYMQNNSMSKNGGSVNEE